MWLPLIIDTEKKSLKLEWIDVYDLNVSVQAIHQLARALLIKLERLASGKSSKAKVTTALTQL